MNLKLKKVSDSNIHEILALKVKDSQLHHIETVEACLAEANEEQAWHPIGIYDEDTPIGFAMYGYIEEEGRVWLDRFLISKECQGKGYAKKSVSLLINKLIEEYGEREIYLSVYASNNRAISLYEDIGFIFNGELDLKGERVMVLNRPTK